MSRFQENCLRTFILETTREQTTQRRSEAGKENVGDRRSQEFPGKKGNGDPGSHCTPGRSEELGVTSSRT